MDLKEREVIGCEALARWIKPNGELASPAQFIPLIEQYGLDDQLLTVMIEEAAKELSGELERRREFFLSFNVTPNQVSRAGFADSFMELMRKTGLQPRQVCVEITERQVIVSPENAASATTKLSEAGFRVAIDDAGTGHNGLASLQLLDASTIKIDKFFVDQVHQDPRSRVMIDMFVSMARRYGMRSVAEGVETHDQITALQDAGVNAVQGYIYSPAIPATEFKSALKSAWNDVKNHGPGGNSIRDPEAFPNFQEKQLNGSQIVNSIRLHIEGQWL